MGMYISEERIERDGYLIAYAGEVMSEDEARKRGLIDVPIAEPTPIEPPSSEEGGSAGEPDPGDAGAQQPDGGVVDDPDAAKQPDGDGTGDDPAGAQEPDGGEATNVQDPSKMTNDQLRDLLDTLGLQYPKNATKPELLEILGE